MSSPITIYTVGHSTHTFEKFLDLLERNGVTAIADVRSIPFSRHTPQFNKDTLSIELKKRGIAYVFVGKGLGAQSDDPSCYEGGKVSYDRLAKTSVFKAGIERVLSEAQKHRIALMCAEKEPLDCHRTLLVSRALEQQGASVVHIKEDGRTEAHPQAMCRLIKLVRLLQVDLFDRFDSHDEQVAEAYRRGEQRVAYVDEALAEKERS